MIYITGDTHGHYDISKLHHDNFPEQADLTKDDYVIICGDFGLLWDHSETERQWRDWLNLKNFTTLFIDGNHENHFLLSQCPVEEWNGGKVHKVASSIYHLMRGQVFNINDNTFFTMGGGYSIDKFRRVEGKSWWAEEMPSQEEYNEGLANLVSHDGQVDYVLTHTAPCFLKDRLIKEGDEKELPLNSYLEFISTQTQYKKWYFGHFHKDEELDNRHQVVYNKIIKLPERK